MRTSGGGKSPGSGNPPGRAARLHVAKAHGVGPSALETSRDAQASLHGGWGGRDETPHRARRPDAPLPFGRRGASVALQGANHRSGGGEREEILLATLRDARWDNSRKRRWARESDAVHGPRRLSPQSDAWGVRKRRECPAAWGASVWMDGRQGGKALVRDKAGGEGGGKDGGRKSLRGNRFGAAEKQGGGPRLANGTAAV